MNTEQKIKYLKEAIVYQTASDIYELPRPEFTKYVNKAKAQDVSLELIPTVVLGMLIAENESFFNKLKRVFTCKK